MQTISYVGSFFGILQGFLYGFGPNLQKWAIRRELAASQEEDREPLPEKKLLMWKIGMVMYTGAGVFQMIGLSLAPYAMVAPFVGLAVPTNILAAKFLNSELPSWNAVVACFLIVPCVAICAICGPIQQVCLDFCHDSGSYSDAGYGYYGATDQMINYLLSGGGTFWAWTYWVFSAIIVIVGFALWQIKTRIKIRNPHHPAIPALYGTIAGFFGGMTTFSLSVLGGIVKILTHPTDMMPIQGYRDIDGGGFQPLLLPLPDGVSLELELGGGWPCWNAFWSWGWWIFVLCAAVVLLLQIRWINRGTKHFGCDVVVPCEVVTNVIIANYCSIFLHSDMYWFDYNLLVRDNASLYWPFIALYTVGNALGVASLIVLGMTHRVDNYDKHDVAMLRWIDEKTADEVEEDSSSWSWWHWVIPTQIYLTPYYRDKLDRKLTRMTNRSKSLEWNPDQEYTRNIVESFSHYAQASSTGGPVILGLEPTNLSQPLIERD